MRKRFIGLVIALAASMILSGCYSLGPWGCARGGVGDCKSNVVNESASPGGSHKAVVAVQTCTYNKKFPSSMTSVRVTGLEAGARLVVGIEMRFPQAVTTGA